jgi:hypothetical protein
MDKQRLVMQKAVVPLLIGLIALTGCANHYVMRLNNGSEITTATKPRLKDGTYHFKDAKGEEQLVPAFAVREVAPASMAERENKAQPMKMKSEKKRKWYLLWLG